ncbi:MAG TPA: TonB-dependent receptor [Gemmatimonadaceae bacterium]|nr:TonB-dependent receptor [Gemmatimonadaceae bacterium]
MQTTFGCSLLNRLGKPAARLAPAMLLVAVVHTPAARAQSPGSILGTVKDSGGKGIPGVEVTVAAARAVVRSDTLGHFRVANVPAGAVDVRFRRFGFEPKTAHTDVTAGKEDEMLVSLDEIALELPGVTVEEETRRRQLMHDFLDRKSRGFGQFITREEIEQRHPVVLSDMMRMIPGARLIPNAVGNTSTLRFARATLPGRDCPPQYWVDGVKAWMLNIDDIEPSDVEGIEIYQGPSGLPPQYNTRDGTTICGTVLIWTRIPG